MILTLGFVLTSEATAQQENLYRLLIKGQPSPFDSAVAVRLDRYREETKKLALGQQLVDSLTEEVFGLYRENALHVSAYKSTYFTIDQLVQANERKDSVNRQLKTYFRKLDTLTEDQKKFQKRTTLVVAGVVLLEIINIFFGN